jgi:hemerythrin
MTARMRIAGESVLEQHAALRRLMGEIQLLLGAPAGPETTRRLSVGLEELLPRLEAHFAHEEDSGLFASIVEKKPEAAHTCAHLVGEHGAFLTRVEHLRQATGSSSLDDLRMPLATLVADLRAHEDVENELVNEALDGSVAAQD